METFVSSAMVEAACISVFTHVSPRSSTQTTCLAWLGYFPEVWELPCRYLRLVIPRLSRERRPIVTMRCHMLSRCDVLTLASGGDCLDFRGGIRLPVGRAVMATVSTLTVMPWKLVCSLPSRCTLQCLDPAFLGPLGSLLGT